MSFQVRIIHLFLGQNCLRCPKSDRRIFCRLLSHKEKLRYRPQSERIILCRPESDIRILCRPKSDIRILCRPKTYIRILCPLFVVLCWVKDYLFVQTPKCLKLHRRPLYHFRLIKAISSIQCHHSESFIYPTVSLMK